MLESLIGLGGLETRTIALDIVEIFFSLLLSNISRSYGHNSLNLFLFGINKYNKLSSMWLLQIKYVLSGLIDFTSEQNIFILTCDNSFIHQNIVTYGYAAP